MRPGSDTITEDTLVRIAPAFRLATKYPEGRRRLCNGSIKNNEMIVTLTRKQTEPKVASNPAVALSLNSRKLHWLPFELDVMFSVIVRQFSTLYIEVLLQIPSMQLGFSFIYKPASLFSIIYQLSDSLLRDFIDFKTALVNEKHEKSFNDWSVFERKFLTFAG
jgi:hypothetical protein